jgi:YVTN family beta-propeller protein
MLFRLLGPLDVRDGERTIELRAPKQRALLALLLLRRDEVVSVESLAEQLWAGDPPATGTKGVRVYVGELRKALGADVIATAAGGYVIPRERSETDIDRFELLAAQGRQRLEDEDVEGAAASFREALALWRGPALADFRYEEFAQNEISRLEDARMAVLEARIDADLALGREEELVPELQALVGEHRNRERLCGQLMLALYRSGRQSDALAVYRDTRRRLVEELGVEPGHELQTLERAILTQDESIGRPRRRQLADRTRKRPAWLVALGAVALLGAVAAAVVTSLTRHGGGRIASVVRGNTVVAIDPSTGHVVAEFPVGQTPTAVAVGGGAVWVLNADDQTISRIDPESKAVKTFGIGATPTDLGAGAGGVWIANGGPLAQAQFGGTAGVALARLDTHTGAVIAKLTLPQSAPVRSNVAEHHVAVAGETVWAVAPDFSVVRVDPRRNKVAAVVPGVAAVAVDAEGGDVWALTDQVALVRITAARNRVTQRVNVPAIGLTDVALGGGSVWATDPYQGTLWRIDPGVHPTERTIDVGAGADGVDYGSGVIWVVNSLRGTLSKIDTRTNRVVRVIPLGSTPRAVAVGAGLVWVAVSGEPVAAASGQQSGQAIRSLPATMCDPLVTGSEDPRFVVASDLPLRGGGRFVTPQMSAAVLHVLRKHAFRAGRYPIAYQSCDDSTPQTGIFDDRKCTANAQAYVGDPDVIGVVGPYNSGCAYDEVPIANRAGLAIVSPTNSDVGLTRRAFDAPRDLLHTLYPTGKRTYARLMSPDDAQAAADAVLAQRLGARKVLLVDDGGYGAAFAAYFAQVAGRLKLDVVRAQWDPHAPRFAGLASRARRSGAQVVFLCGLIDSGAGEVLASLRAAMPRSTQVIGCDGLLPVSLLFEHAGATARGVYVSIEGIVNERLGSAGRKFLRDFGSTQPGAKVDIASVYAAQATELLVAAIARSDGTRASVSRELLKGRVQDGLLGSFEIDPAGDPSPAPVTIVRVEHGGGADIVQSYDGARVDRVITPPSRLLGGTPKT